MQYWFLHSYGNGFFQRKYDSSSSDDSDAEKSKYLTPVSSVPVTPAGDVVVEKKHKKKHKKDRGGETVDTPAQDTAEKKVCLTDLYMIGVVNCWSADWINVSTGC